MRIKVSLLIFMFLIAGLCLAQQGMALDSRPTANVPPEPEVIKKTFTVTSSETIVVTHEVNEQPITITIHANIIDAAPERGQAQRTQQQWMCNLATPGPNVRVVPAMPDPRTGRVHNLQVGSYNFSHSAFDLAHRMKAAGFNVALERWRDLHRVVVIGISACQIFDAVHCLGNLGITEIWVRN